MDFFAPSEPKAPETHRGIAKPWTVLVIDDEPEVHTVTRLALRGFEFQNQKVEILSALSAKESLEIFKERDDIALAMIDVVMETDHAGLDLIRTIREELKNQKTRLVLRTGQPGQAPEDRVIKEYDIDDYKEKTELTTQKLRTMLYSTLRAYRDICVIEAQRDGLSRVLESCSNVQSSISFKQFASAVLSQLTSLLNLGNSAIYCMEMPQSDNSERGSRVLAATGEYVDYIADAKYEDLPKHVAQRFKESSEQERSLSYDDAYVLFTKSRCNSVELLYVHHYDQLSELNQQLLELYMNNVAISFENINLFEDFQETARELVCILANAVEARSRETGAHVLRVALASKLLGELYGLSAQEVELIKQASPLHDIGKVAIPDSILHKPGKLTAEEWEIMKKHAEYGVTILSESKRDVMRMGSIIAGTHHEKWDGSGYPKGLEGDEIPIYGRITAIADVFDALGTKRSYKEAWKDEDIFNFIKNERGRHFDPSLVDLFIDNFESFVSIRNQYADDVGI